MNKRDQQRIDEIRHRLERVTPGPWRQTDWTDIVAMRGTPEEVRIARTELWDTDPDQDDANASFLAHSLDDIVWLTELVRDLEQAVVDREPSGE